MSGTRAITLWTCLALALLPAVASAQAANDRVHAELDRTDLHIASARAVVSGAGNASAHAEFDRAVETQAGARSALAQDRPRLAAEMTVRARAGADRAIAIVNGLPDPDRVLGQLERTREMTDNARGRVEECKEDRARALLRAAEDMQRRAEEAAQGGYYLAALQLTMGARERALRGLRQCNAADDGGGAEERMLRRTDRAIRRAQHRLGDGPPANARPLLSRAIDLQARAQQEYRAQHLEASVRLTLSARALAVRAARIAGRIR